MNDKAGDIRSRLQATEAELATAQTERQTAANDLAERTARLADLTNEHEAANTAIELGRKQHIQLLQAAAALRSQVDAGESRLATVAQAIVDHHRQLSELAGAKTGHEAELAAAETQQQSIASQLAEQTAQVEAAETELTECRNLHASRSADLAQLHGRQLAWPNEPRCLKSLSARWRELGRESNSFWRRQD